MSDLHDLLAQDIRDEAEHYPGETEGQDHCLLDEIQCMEDHIHQQWVVDGKVKMVIATPERIASVAAWTLANLLRQRGAEELKRADVTGRVIWSRRYRGNALLDLADEIDPLAKKEPHVVVTTSTMDKIISVRLPGDVYELLKAHSVSRGESVSDAVRRATQMLLAEELPVEDDVEQGKDGGSEA